MEIKQVRKALVAAFMAAAAAATGGEIVGSVDTLGEWSVVLIAAVIAGVTTWRVPNE